MSTVSNQATGATAPSGTAPPSEERKYNFPVSEVPRNPLGEGRYIKTAAALIIGYVKLVELCQAVLSYDL